MMEGEMAMTGSSALRVAVIGAGVSGLSAAQRLILNNQATMEVNIYEATDRIGGRIHTYKYGMGHVERGAAWIHGCSQENPLFSLALQHGLGPVDKEVPKFVMSELPQMTYRGDLVPLPLRSQLQEVFYYLLDGPDSVTLKGDESSGTAPQNGFRRRDEQDGSVGSYVFCMLRGYLDNVSKQEGPEKRKLFLSILQQLVSEEFISNACSSLFDLDMDAFDSYKEFSGGDFALPTGYQAILDSILKDIPEDRLHLNQPVTKIAWMNNSDGDSQSSVKLHFQNGETKDVDVVLVTSSLGFLKHNSPTLFQPSLPADKLRSMQKLGFGVVNKVQLQYNQPFWESDWKGIRLLWDCDSVDRLEGDWSIKDEWFKRIAFVRRVFFSEDVLETLIAGEEGEFIETLDPREIGKAITDLLRKFTSNPSIPEPDQIEVTKWASHPYIRGSYSYISTQATSQDVEKLAEPVSVEDSRKRLWPRICFAGEATSKHYFSTVHGALLSGRREADRLITFNQSLKEQTTRD